MGDRLVCVIRKDGIPLAASYQHWEASGHEYMNGIINHLIDGIEKPEDFSTEDAVYLLLKALKEYNGSDKGIGLTVRHNDWLHGDEEFSSEEEQKFACLHPDIECKDFNRNDGMITINPREIEFWEGWGEWEEDFDIY